MGERGQVAPLAAILIVLIGVAAITIGRLGRDANDAARARTAADAAALAGALDGADAAEAMALVNGAVLERLMLGDNHAEVIVRVHGAAAAARAVAEGQRPEHEGLAPAMLAALARAEQLLGEPIPIVSGYRSPAAQRALWERRHTNPYPVAPPGTSLHERGLAVDIPLPFVPRLLGVAASAGLCRPLPATDPVHFELCPTSGTR